MNVNILKQKVDLMVVIQTHLSTGKHKCVEKKCFK